MLPGWKAERAGRGYAMISRRVAAERRRAENGDCSGEGGQPPGSVMMLYPRIFRETCPGRGHLMPTVHRPCVQCNSTVRVASWLF